MSNKTPLIHTIVIIIATGVVTNGITFFAQKNFISKSEENNLIRELIPSLTSNNPRQIDMALLLLEGTVEEKKYKVIKGIMDKKVEILITDTNAFHESIEPVKSKKQSNIENPLKKNYQEKIFEYANQREDWKKIIKDKQFEISKPFTKENLLQLLESIDAMTIDKNLKEIVILTAKKINKKDYFSAGVSLDWLLHYHNDNRSSTLLGLTKSNFDKKQILLLKKYFSENGYEMLQQIFNLKILANFDFNANTAGEKLDIMNHLFLLELKEDKPFEAIFNPSPQPFKSKFENVQ